MIRRNESGCRGGLGLIVDRINLSCAEEPRGPAGKIRHLPYRRSWRTKYATAF